MPPKPKRRCGGAPASPTDPPFPNPVPTANQPTTETPATDQTLLQLLVDVRRDQLSQQQQMETINKKLASSQKQAHRPPAPIFQSKSFTAQYQFNAELRALVADAKDSLHDPDVTTAILTEIDDKLADRNKSLHIADSIPGALTAIDKAKEIESIMGTKSDSVMASLLPQLLNTSRPAASTSRAQPFRATGGRFQSPPVQYPTYSAMPQTQPPFMYPYQPGTAIPGMPSFQPGYYGQQAPQWQLVHGQRAPHTIIGPCNGCQAFGHLHRECPINPLPAKTPFAGYSQPPAALK